MARARDLGLFALLLLHQPAAGQDRVMRLQVGPDRAVASDAPTTAHVEPYLAVDSAEPGRLLVGAIVFRSERMTVDLLTSQDGGESWRRTPFPDCQADPWLAMPSPGHVYFTCAGSVEQPPVPQLVYRSSNGGRSWTGPTHLPFGDGGSFDHASLVVAPESGRDTVYVVGLQSRLPDARPARPLAVPFVARSTDGGTRFDRPQHLLWSDVMSNPVNPVLLPNGDLGIVFYDFSVDGRHGLESKRLWWIRWDAAAQKASLPHLVAETHAATTLPLLAAVRMTDGTTLLHTAFDDRREDRAGVFLVTSRDEGDSWDAPRPIATEGEGASSFANPVVASGSGGTLAVAWYEQTADAEDRCWRIRFTASLNGGATFLEPTTVSSTVFCVAPSSSVPNRRWPAGGDYFGLAEAEPGTFRLVWADARSGTYQLRTAAVQIIRDDR